MSFVLVRRLGYRVMDVAAALGLDVATISVIVSRLASRMESNAIGTQPDGFETGQSLC